MRFISSLLMGAAVLLVVGVVLSGLSAQVSNPGGQTDESKIQIGFTIAPVPLDLKGKDRALVGLGSYLVNTTCVSCHTCPTYVSGHDPFKGQPEEVNTTNYLAGGKIFGPYVSRNLTPEDGLPAGRTLAQFESILRFGIDYDNAHPSLPLLQVMPWPDLKSLTSRDIQAMYEYLRAIPPAKPSGAAGCAIPQ